MLRFHIVFISYLMLSQSALRNDVKSVCRVNCAIFSINVKQEIRRLHVHVDLAAIW